MNYLKLVFLVLFVIPSVVVGQKVVNSNFLGNWANSGTGACSIMMRRKSRELGSMVFMKTGLLHTLISGNINEWNSEKNEWRLYWKMAIRR